MMEEIYENMERAKPVCQNPATNHRASSTSKRRLYLSVIITLGLLTVFMLVGLIVLGRHYADLSNINDNLHERLQASIDQHSINLTEVTKELITCQSSLKRKKTCPATWTMSNGSCYLLSTKSGSWDEGRQDCRNHGADLVVIEDTDEQAFIISFTQKYIWIGLNDKETEGSWKWVDGTPITLELWAPDQPDNGGGDPQWGEEDCAEIRITHDTLWNDLSCSNSKQWICEKLPA